MICSLMMFEKLIQGIGGLLAFDDKDSGLPMQFQQTRLNDIVASVGLCIPVVLINDIYPLHLDASDKLFCDLMDTPTDGYSNRIRQNNGWLIISIC